MSKSEGKRASKKAEKVGGAAQVDEIMSEDTPAKEKSKKDKKENKYKKEKKERQAKMEKVQVTAQAEEVAESDKPSKQKKDKTDRKEKKSAKPKTDKPAAVSTFGAGKGAFDPTISSLFANSLGASKPSISPAKPAEDESDEDGGVAVEEDDEELSEIEVNSDDEELAPVSEDEEQSKPSAPAAADDADKKRKRKRKDDNDDLEGVYMDRLAREEAKEAAKQKEERASNKRQKTAGDTSGADQDEDASDEDEEMADGESASDDEEAGTPPPTHESLLPEVDEDLVKSQRTVFLANVSTTAITSKSAEKELRNHLSSFFSELDAPAKDQPAHKIESIRFRSTAFATAIPKKAAFAKKELMDATTRSTNAYVVYSSPQLSREAARRLNGTMVLDRHLRVDEVAHPAKVDHKRCIFVGNLGFVDDESNIDQANEEEGMGKRNGRKVPSDIEEGLWRTFGTCGTVESVRVVRDSKTRVGKGFAYVQFTDENAVEAALLHNEKKFPPMLPRKLRISRAKAIKRNAKPGSSTARPPTHTRAKGAGGVYNPKMSGQEASNLGRAGKLLGRAAAAQLRTGDVKGRDGSNIRGPEAFIFEGHRASNKGGKTGLKLGGKKGGGSKGKPGGRSAKRGAAWKSSGGKN